MAQTGWPTSYVKLTTQVPLELAYEHQRDPASTYSPEGEDGHLPNQPIQCQNYTHSTQQQCDTNGSNLARQATRNGSPNRSFKRGTGSPKRSKRAPGPTAHADEVSMRDMETAWDDTIQDVWELQASTAANAGMQPHSPGSKKYGAWFVPPNDWQHVYTPSGPSLKKEVELAVRAGVWPSDKFPQGPQAQLQHAIRVQDVQGREQQVQRKLRSAYGTRVYKDHLKANDLRPPEHLSGVKTPTPDDIARAEAYEHHVQAREETDGWKDSSTNNIPTQAGSTTTVPAPHPALASIPSIAAPQRNVFSAFGSASTRLPSTSPFHDMDLDEIISPEMRAAVRKTLAMNEALAEHEARMKKHDQLRRRELAMRARGLNITSTAADDSGLGLPSRCQTANVNTNALSMADEDCASPAYGGQSPLQSARLRMGVSFAKEQQLPVAANNTANNANKSGPITLLPVDSDDDDKADTSQMPPNFHNHEVSPFVDSQQPAITQQSEQVIINTEPAPTNTQAAGKTAVPMIRLGSLPHPDQGQLASDRSLTVSDVLRVVTRGAEPPVSVRGPLSHMHLKTHILAAYPPSTPPQWAITQQTTAITGTVGTTTHVVFTNSPREAPQGRSRHNSPDRSISPPKVSAELATNVQSPTAVTRATFNWQALHANKSALHLQQQAPLAIHVLGCMAHKAKRIEDIAKVPHTKPKVSSAPVLSSAIVAPQPPSSRTHQDAIAHLRSSSRAGDGIEMSNGNVSASLQPPYSPGRENNVQHRQFPTDQFNPEFLNLSLSWLRGDRVPRPGSKQAMTVATRQALSKQSSCTFLDSCIRSPSGMIAGGVSSHGINAVDTYRCPLGTHGYSDMSARSLRGSDGLTKQDLQAWKAAQFNTKTNEVPYVAAVNHGKRDIHSAPLLKLPAVFHGGKRLPSPVPGQ